ncbi:MAG: hypothetical protein R3Y67_05890 [Eubacteriales bacterium]
MAYNYASVQTAYNCFLPSYQPKTSSAQDSHKKSDLKNIYNAIRQMYKDSPIYLLDTSIETKESAVALKDTALQFGNSLASFAELSKNDILEHQIAYSSNEEIATAKLLSASDHSAQPFELEVHSLASSQVNIGSLLTSDTTTFLEKKPYIFHVSSNDYNYEFSFQIGKNDTNLDVQNRLSNLINHSNIGIHASVIEEAAGQSALRLESMATGISGSKHELFSVFGTRDEAEASNAKFISYFGLNHTTQNPENSSYSVNGQLRSSTSNTFHTEQSYEVTLRGISPLDGLTTTIDTRSDVNGPYNAITDFVQEVNDFATYVQDYSKQYPKSLSLLRDMNASYRTYQDAFSSVGITKDDNGSINIDNTILGTSLLDTSEHENISYLRNFAKDLSNVTKKIAIHPMQYSENKIIDYKHPQKSFAAAYITSAYSGFLFNSYC